MTLDLNLSPYYSLSFEFLWFGLIVHSTVKTKYTPAVKRAYKRDLREVALTFRKPIYAFQARDHDPKKRKFILSLGFQFDHYRQSEDGEMVEFYRFRHLD